MIYLDNAASTMVPFDVLETMLPYITESYGNAGAVYSVGRQSRYAIDKARAQVATLFGCKPDQVLFTSGGSEANSMVFRGVIDYLRGTGQTHILVSAVEHDSAIKAARSLIGEGFDVEFVPVTDHGEVSANALRHKIKEKTGLVSVMYVNNETGAANPVDDIGEICEKYGILFHTDCVQAAGTHEINVAKIGCDFATISAHKIHGPKGVGALYVRDPNKLTPLIYGGAEQEYGLRGGTENVPGIVAMGKACETCYLGLHDDMIRVSIFRQRFYTELLNELAECGLNDLLKVNGPPVIVPGKILNICVKGVDAETLLLMLDSRGVCVSAGSACRSHEAEPSHVLTAMGLSNEDARSSIRISFSKLNTTDEVIEAARIFADCISVLLECNTE